MWLPLAYIDFYCFFQHLFSGCFLCLFLIAVVKTRIEISQTLYVIVAHLNKLVSRRWRVLIWWNGCWSREVIPRYGHIGSWKVTIKWLTSSCLIYRIQLLFLWLPYRGRRGTRTTWWGRVYLFKRTGFVQEYDCLLVSHSLPFIKNYSKFIGKLLFYKMPTLIDGPHSQMELESIFIAIFVLLNSFKALLH